MDPGVQRLLIGDAAGLGYEGAKIPPLVLGSILKSAPSWSRGCFALSELVAVFASASSSVKHWLARGAPLRTEGLKEGLDHYLGVSPSCPPTATCQFNLDRR